VASRRKSGQDEPVFRFFGTIDGVIASIQVERPVRRGSDEWTSHLTMSGPFRANVNTHITGVSEEQSLELALGLCHVLVAGRRLLDKAGEVVVLPGKPLPEPTDVGDRRRAEKGLGVCLVDEGNGQLRLVLDDVAREGSTWKDFCFYTHKRYPKEKLLELLLSEKELAEIGFALMARLVVLTFPGQTGRKRNT
jgi:hypothetical protein